MKKRIIHFFKDYGIAIGVLLFFWLITFIPLPYYIEGPGGLISVSNRFSIEGNNNDSSYYMAYVSNYKGTIPNLVIALVKKDYDIYKQTNERGNTKEADYRNHLMLDEANQDALIYAYLKASKQVDILEEEIYITYADPDFHHNFKIGDRIISVDSIPITKKEQLQEIISDAGVNQKLVFQVEYNGSIEERYAYVKEIGGSKKIGILPTLKRKIEVEPAITFHFEESESGSSGGFMMTLAIYDVLTQSNFSKKLKIAGTGTIDINGNVGEIGGIKYKILGAVQENADIFFVPRENYKEAKQTLEKTSSHMELVLIDTFDDAIMYLKKYE